MSKELEASETSPQVKRKPTNKYNARYLASPKGKATVARHRSRKRWEAQHLLKVCEPKRCYFCLKGDKPGTISK